ncbi:serine hydrolase [Solwaraspora sp. WMMD1047]|uniref:serine hydrolase domain-containing protein n=1 Tax=Solwaraspora sp. WMMD1047 TaxID=3016102 RepID=UPI0024165B92|nr:serine hydrolase domain-containing protein [Solwaraspora sp. WMMD1047]MDG4833871.1 serine hydrolase [Solwaraspora sp. WMMD1047]
MRQKALVIVAVAAIVGLVALWGAPGPPVLSDRRTGDPDLAAAARAAVGDPAGHRGLAVAVVEDGRVRTAGLGDRGAGSPVAADTPFEMGSLGKVLTGMLLAELAADGTVDPDDTLRDTWPEVSGPVGGVTLAELASHRAGLPKLPITSIGHGLRLYWANLSAGNPYAGQDAAWIAETTGGRTPGDRRGEVHYSNYGMALLGQALAARTGQPYPELLAQRILRPLGMERTTFAADADQLPAGHADGSTASGRPAAPWTGTGWAPAGIGGWTTAEDLGKLLAAMLAGTAPGADAATPRFTEDDRSKIGYGWFTTSYGDQEIVWHNGGTGGFRTYIGFDRSAGRAVALLGNTTTDVDPIGLRMLGAQAESGDAGEANPLAPLGLLLALGFTLYAPAMSWFSGLRGRDRLGLVSNTLWAALALLLAYRLGDWQTVPGWLWAIGAGLTAAGAVPTVLRWHDLPTLTGRAPRLRWISEGFAITFGLAIAIAALT